MLLLSHNFERDKTALKAALAARCAYIGLLSSKVRRDQLYEDLIAEGVAAKDLTGVFCPIGADIKGRSDPEIAVSIAAELVEVVNR